MLSRFPLRKLGWFILILLIIFAQFQVTSFAQDPCSGDIVKIDWYDMTNPNNWVFQYQSCHPANEVEACAPGYSRVGNVATNDNFCVFVGLPIEPPNYPGINAGAACLAGTSRTVTIIPTGNSHELQISPSNQIINMIGNSHLFNNMQEGVNYRFRAQATNGGGSSGWSNWTGIVQHDLSAPVTSLDLVGLTGNNDWWRSTVSATLPSIDTGCLGVAETHYILDSIAALYNANPIIISGDGEHSLEYYSSDGVHVEVTQNSLIRIDTVAPSITISPDRLPDGQNGWWLAPVTLSISGTDASSGIASTEYDLNATGWQPYTSAITLNTNGTYSFDGRVFDNAGWETVDGLSIPLDMTAPRLEFVAERAPDRNGWYNASVHVALDYGDNTSGVNAVVARLNNSEWEAYQGAYLIGGNGEHVFQAIVRDTAGNTTTRQTIIPIDISPPLTTVNYDGQAITLSVTDNLSGVLGTTLSINGVVTTYNSNPIPLGEAGEYVIEAYSTDVAGNSESTQIMRINHDPNASNVAISSGVLPVLQTTLDCVAPSYNVTGFASAGSGLSEVYLIAQPENGNEVVLRGQGQSYSYNPNSSNVEAVSFTYLAQSEASHRFIVVAMDASGNERRQTLTCPSTSLIVAAPINGNGNASIRPNNPSTSEDTARIVTYPITGGRQPQLSPERGSRGGEMALMPDNSLPSIVSPGPMPYNGYVAPSTTVELLPPTSMDLTYVSPSNDLPLGAGELAKILAAVGLVTTTAAGVVLQQSETAKKKQDELQEKLDADINAANQAFAEQINNAQANAAMNAQMQANKDKEVILEVQQSEANKAYHEHIAALWGEYHRKVGIYQEAEYARQQEQRTSIPNLDEFLNASEIVENDILQQYYALKAELGADHPLVRDLAYMQYLVRTSRENEDYQALAENMAKGAAYAKAGQEFYNNLAGGGFGDAPDTAHNASAIGYPPDGSGRTYNQRYNVPMGELRAEAEMNNLPVSYYINDDKAQAWQGYLREQYDVTWTTENAPQDYAYVRDNLLAVYNTYQATDQTAKVMYEEYASNSATLPEEIRLANVTNRQDFFKEIMGPITVRYTYNPAYNGEGNDANAVHTRLENGSHVIEVSAHAEPHTFKFQYNLAHEFGHVFNNRMDNYPADRLAELGIIAGGNAWSYQGEEGWVRNQNNNPNDALHDGMPNLTSGTDIDGDGFPDVFEQNPVANPAEEFADMFAYWIYGGYDTSPVANLRHEYVEQWMMGAVIYEQMRANPNVDVNSIISQLTSNNTESNTAAGLDIVSQIAKNPENYNFQNLGSINDTYRNALTNAYGLTIRYDEKVENGVIVSTLEPDYEALANYHRGVELVAILFNQVIEAEYSSNGQTVDFNRFGLYQQVMGNMEVYRTYTRPDGSEGGNGYTSGHIIYDIYDSERRPYEPGNALEQTMTDFNFTHELGHAFMAFSGMGDYNKSPFSTQLNNGSPYTEMQNIDSGRSEFYQTLDIFDFSDVPGYSLRQNPTNSLAENGADIFLYSTLGLTNLYNEAILAAMRQAALYHTPYDEHALTMGWTQEGDNVQFADLQIDNSQTTISRYDSRCADEAFQADNRSSCIWNLRSTPTSNDARGDNRMTGILRDTNQEVTILATNNNPNDTWYYIAISHADSLGNTTTRYGWVSGTILGGDAVSPQPPSSSSLPPLTFDTYLNRPFDINDPIVTDIFSEFNELASESAE